MTCQLVQTLFLNYIYGNNVRHQFFWFLLFTFLHIKIKDISFQNFKDIRNILKKGSFDTKSAYVLFSHRHYFILGNLDGRNSLEINN